MSVIEVKSTRSLDNAAAARDRFEDKAGDRKSLTPFYLGFSIAALVLYLKGSSSPQAAVHEEPQGNPSHGEQSSAMDAYVAPDIGPNDFQIPDEAYDTARFDPLRPISQPSAHFVFNPANPPDKPVSLDLGYRAPAANSVMSFGKPVSFLALSSNDNGHVAGPDSTGAANAGSGRPASHSAPDQNEDDDSDSTTVPNRKNTAPKVSGPVSLSDQFVYSSVLIAVADLLGNASDADAGDVLSVKDLRINGVAVPQLNGNYLYHGEQLGPVVLTYQVTDGELSVAATASFDLLAKPPIVGTAGDDHIVGTAYPDEIRAGEGNDQVDGFDGDDVILGGRGNDHIFGGDGNDVIYGDDGNDVIFGGFGNDMLSGGFGNDRLFGGYGNDILQGGSGYDTLYGDDGDDVLAGGSERDWLYDGYGTDHVDGESGNDTVFAKADNSNDLFNGGTGTDRLSFADHQSDLVFDLSLGTVAGDGTAVDQFAGFEIFEAGNGNDAFLAVAPEAAASAPKTFIGGEGNDTLDYGVAQHSITIDLVRGTASGAELGINYFEEIEHFATGSGDDVFVAAGTDTAIFMAIVDEDGNAGNAGRGDEGTTTPELLNAVMAAKPFAQSLGALAGSDRFDGGEGHDTIDYSAATHGITVNTQAATATGEDIGTDIFTGIEEFIGGDGDDTFIIGEGEVTLDGRAGNDMFQFLTATTFDPDSYSKHEIKGFEVGDWVRMSKYDIFERAVDAVQDAFESAFDGTDGTKIDGTEQDLAVPIRIRHEVSDNLQQTFIDADFDQNGSYEMSIQIDGDHHLNIVETHIA